MTRYTVTWVQDALDGLTELWLDASDRAAISRAAAEVDQQLAVDPDHKGDDLHEGLRVEHFPPLRVIYEAQSSDRLVVVRQVRQW